MIKIVLFCIKCHLKVNTCHKSHKKAITLNHFKVCLNWKLNPTNATLFTTKNHHLKILVTTKEMHHMPPRVKVTDRRFHRTRSIRN